MLMFNTVFNADRVLKPYQRFGLVVLNFKCGGR
jgi:hypothetical protein